MNGTVPRLAYLIRFHDPYYHTIGRRCHRMIAGVYYGRSRGEIAASLYEACPECVEKPTRE